MTRKRQKSTNGPTKAIRISVQNWEQLKKWAEPLEDTPNDALTNLLKTAEKHRPKRKYTRKRERQATPRDVQNVVRFGGVRGPK